MRTETVDDAIRRFLAHRQAKRVSKATESLYRRHATHWSEWRVQQGLAPEVAAITAEELCRFLIYLQHEHVPHGTNTRRPAVARRGMAVATVASYYRLLRALWRFLDAEECLSAQQARFFTAGRVPAPRYRPRVRAACDEERLAKLLTGCDDETTEEGARDRALLLMLFESGLRVSELCALTDDRVNLAQREVLICGKGDVERFVFWGPRTSSALLRYLCLRRGKRCGPLFRGISSRNDGEALTPDLVRCLMKRLAKRAGVKLPPGAPVHWMRHGFAHSCIDAGLDIWEVGQLMGHADVKTTQEYLRQRPDRLAASHEHVFGRRRAGGQPGGVRSAGVHERRRSER